MTKITGKFDVKLTPLDVEASGHGGITLGRMLIDKHSMGT